MESWTKTPSKSRPGQTSTTQREKKRTSVSGKRGKIQEIGGGVNEYNLKMICRFNNFYSFHYIFDFP
jgi:hypothetical protein